MLRSGLGLGQNEQITVLRTLIVEDNVAFRQSLRGLLRAGLPGSDVIEAGDGKEALRQIASAEPDLILMDIRLPGENGLDLTKKIKATHPQIVIAIITNHDLPEYRQAAADNGASYFIPKDTSTKELLAIIKSVCASRAQPVVDL